MKTFYNSKKSAPPVQKNSKTTLNYKKDDLIEIEQSADDNKIGFFLDEIKDSKTEEPIKKGKRSKKQQSKNSKKTKWMRFGYEHDTTPIIIQVNNESIEKVIEFKFLGVTLSNEHSFKSHLNKRKSMCFSGLAEIEKLGFNEFLPANLKKVL